MLCLPKHEHLETKLFPYHPTKTPRNTFFGTVKTGWLGGGKATFILAQESLAAVREEGRAAVCRHVKAVKGGRTRQRHGESRYGP
jgi:hypothetical protein